MNWVPFSTGLESILMTRSFLAPLNCLVNPFSWGLRSEKIPIVHIFSMACRCKKFHSTYGPSIASHSIADISACLPSPIVPMNANNTESEMASPLPNLGPPGPSTNKNSKENMDFFSHQHRLRLKFASSIVISLAKHNNNLHIASLGVFGLADGGKVAWNDPSTENNYSHCRASGCEKMAYYDIVNKSIIPKTHKNQPNRSSIAIIPQELHSKWFVQIGSMLGFNFPKLTLNSCQ